MKKSPQLRKIAALQIKAHRLPKVTQQLHQKQQELDTLVRATSAHLEAMEGCDGSEEAYDKLFEAQAHLHQLLGHFKQRQQYKRRTKGGRP